MSKITLDYSKAGRFVSAEEVKNMKIQVEAAKKVLLDRSGAGNDFLGWIDLPVDYDKEEFARIQKAAEKIRNDSEVLLVIGIGGSYLGARAAIEFLRHSFYNMIPKEKRGTPEIYFVGNSISTRYISHLIDVIGDRDFSINMNYQIGGKVYDYTYQTLMHTGGTTATNWHIDMMKAWTPENPNTDVPRLLYSETYSQSARSDRFITNASYLNIQNINFGYTLPSKLTQKYNIQNIRVYFSGENLFYVAARRGLDPRYTLQGYTNPELYSPIRTISGGISLTF